MKPNMTSRERIRRTLTFETPDRLPKDLGGMRSTGISCFLYPKLRAALGLTEKLPKIHDPAQMLALPDNDVLDALGCDVAEVTCPLHEGALFDTNAWDDDDNWHEFDFNGRLTALVRDPSIYEIENDTIFMHNRSHSMPPSSYVFDAIHGGQPLNLSGDLPRFDLDRLAGQLQRAIVSDRHVQQIAAYCRRARTATSRAILFNGLSAGLGFPFGLANWSMLCMLDPAYVHEYHKLKIQHALANIRKLLPHIRDSVDIIMLSADDHGTQQSTILPPRLFAELYAPYYRQLNDEIHAIAPNCKTFLHSCGAIFDILELIIEAGFDILNPVQWCAGPHSFREWKDRCRGRIALWGGGVNTQTTLPLADIPAIEAEVREVTACLASGNGYVFCAIHNLLAEIDPAKVIAIYRTASRCFP